MNYKRKSRHRFFLLMRSRTPPISSWIPLWNSNGADSHFCHYAYVTSCLERKENTTVWVIHSWCARLFTKQLKKWVKVVFLLGCYRCIFHRTGNSAQLCQNFRISREGGGGSGVENPKPTLGTPLLGSWFRCSEGTWCIHLQVSRGRTSSGKIPVF